jgi:hypothetical protein
MLAFADHQFRLASTDENGVTIREKLESISEKTGKRPDSLDGPEMPDGTEYIWRWFLELSSSRGSNGFGPMPITFSDIHAWMAITGSMPRKDEIDLIREMDRVFLGQITKRKES